MNLRKWRVLMITGIALVFLTLVEDQSAATFPILPSAEVSADSQDALVPWLGGYWFLAGANVSWQNGGFGGDFGTVEEWGQHTYDHDRTDQMFAELKGDGANAVRWWVFADGRGAPEFDSDSGGMVTGLDSDFLPSMEDAVKLAETYNIFIIFNLWSFDMLMDDGVACQSASPPCEHAGGHQDLIVDSDKRQSFINNAL